MKKYIIVLFLIHICLLTFSQKPDESLEELLDFVNETKGYKEGFVRSIGANDFKYHSIRTDINECLLTRATDGNMAIEWITAPVNETNDTNGVGFIWIAAMDITGSKHVFDFYMNDTKRFSIPTSQVYNWSLETEDGGSLRFYTKERDHHGDALGYMALWAPESWLIPDKPQKFKIVGEAAGSNNWIIVYKAPDAASFLQHSIKFDKWLTLNAMKEGSKYEISIVSPGYFAGETLFFSTDREQGSVETELYEKNAVGQFTISTKAVGKSLTIKDSNSEILAVESFGMPGSTTKLLAKAILQIEQKTDEEQTIYIKARRVYHPKTVLSLNDLAGSNLSEGKIYLMNSSHQDIAWMDSPEKCVLERDTMLLTPLFELASRNPEYRFDVEDALMLKEYAQRHPEKQDLIRKMLSDGRISCGATYIQPYEEMYSGESLARQFYFGAKWLKDKFNYQSSVYWNVDVPGRTLQMPQIMKKAGIEFLMMSRFEKGFYHWYSPDGSFITAFSPGHYADAFGPLQKNFYEASQYIGSSSLFWAKYYKGRSSGTVIPLLSDWDMSPAVDYFPMIKQWNLITELQTEDGDFIPVSLPGFKIASGDEFFTALSDGIQDLPVIKGERPALWLYIHGPSHQKALKASREGDILLTQAEKFATANAWIDGSFKNYPHEELTNAWEAKIYPDHGWGGKNGDITDHLFYNKFQYAKNEGKLILDRTLKDIASKIKTDPQKGTPLMVFNSLNWSRTDVTTARLYFDPGEAEFVLLKDALGREIPVQMTGKEHFKDGSVMWAEICFIAENVPSIGYKTYYYLPGSRKENFNSESEKNIENRFYRIEFGDGGLTSIYDKELRKELIDPSKFKAGEIFTMRSVGNGAGEFADVQQPDMEGFDKSGNYSTTWQLKQKGPVYSSYWMRQPIRNAIVEQEVIVYHNLKRIDFNIDILNWEGILYREFRFALPLNMTDGQVVYEVPYGVLEVGKDEMEGNAGERYIYPCKETRPRGIQNWIGAYNQDISVILSSSVAVADYIDPTAAPIPNQMLQPILFASRKSCHWEGNDYLQTGDHSFHFSLFSTAPDWRKGYRSGIQANEKLLTIVDPGQYLLAGLPEEKSFIRIDASNFIITTLKKAEDLSNAVIRMVEMEGKVNIANLYPIKKIEKIYQTNLIEEPIKEITISKGITLNIDRYAIETYSLE